MYYPPPAKLSDDLLEELLDRHVLLAVFQHYFSYCHLEIFLSDMDTSLPESVHSRLRTHCLQLFILLIRPGENPENFICLRSLKEQMFVKKPTEQAF